MLKKASLVKDSLRSKSSLLLFSSASFLNNFVMFIYTSGTGYGDWRWNYITFSS
jgi:hypothetical protein